MLFRTPSRAASTLSVAIILLIATSLLAQQLQPRPANASKVARNVCEMVEANHISQQPIDDRTSAKLVDEFIKALDSQKMYFLQADIDKFNKYRGELDDLLKAGNVDFAAQVFGIYLQRLDERIAVANQLIDGPHDFTVNETIPLDYKDAAWAKTAEELNERWRKRIKYDLLLTHFDKTPEADAKKRLHKRYKNVKDVMSKTDPDEIIEMYLTALCMTFDPHSSYMSPRSQEDFRIMMGLKLEGIGAALKAEDGYTIVASVVPGGAAASDGRLKTGDKITAVSNGTGDFVDVVEMKLTKVVDMIRGKAGTKVRLRVLTAAGNETKVYELTRQQIELKSQEVKGEIIDLGDRVKGSRGKIGVIHIPSFYRDFQGAEAGDNNFKSTSRDVKTVLKSFQSKGGVDAVVIDLRYNGGGALTEAIEVSGLFIDEGAVVQVKNQKGKSKPLFDEESGVDYSGPLVVVTNRLAASASEIFAGVIKDYGRGIIVGDRTTHGKGTVQSVMGVGKEILQLFGGQDLGALKLTINQFYRVNGDSTQNLGVPSDIALPSLLDNMDLGESFLDNAMPFGQIAAAKHVRLGQVSPEIVSALREHSRKRVASNADFQKTERDIERYLARKQRKVVSLNEEELRKERVEEEQKTKEKAESSEESSDEPIFPDNSYNNELLSITFDYLAQLREVAKISKK